MSAQEIVKKKVDQLFAKESLETSVEEELEKRVKEIISKELKKIMEKEAPNIEYLVKYMISQELMRSPRAVLH